MKTFVPSTKNIHGPIIPQFILDKKITSGAKLVYALLCDYASSYKKDHSFPSHAKLAERLSCSVSSVKNYLSELAALNLISVQRRQNSSSMYYMMLPDCLKGKESNNSSQQPINDYAQPITGYVNTHNKQQENTTPPLPPVPVPRSLPPASRPVGGRGFSLHDFEKIWAAYPNKKGEEFARYAYRKLHQNGLLPTENVLLASIARFTATESWQRENGRFIPQLSYWLRDQRWLDAISNEEAEAARLRQESIERELARKQEEEARTAKHNAKWERLWSVYEAFKAKFPAESDGLESMLRGTWLHLHECGGLTAADVPDGNTLSIRDFLQAYKQRCLHAANQEARTARDSQADSQRKTPIDNAALPQCSDFMARFFPAPLCAAA